MHESEFTHGQSTLTRVSHPIPWSPPRLNQLTSDDKQDHFPHAAVAAPQNKEWSNTPQFKRQRVTKWPRV